MIGYFRERALRAACLVITAAALCGSAAQAANPASGTVSDSSTQQGPTVAYSGPSADGTHWLARINNTSAFTVVITGSVICASVGS